MQRRWKWRLFQKVASKQKASDISILNSEPFEEQNLGDWIRSYKNPQGRRSWYCWKYARTQAMYGQHRRCSWRVLILFKIRFGDGCGMRRRWKGGRWGKEIEKEQDRYTHVPIPQMNATIMGCKYTQWSNIFILKIPVRGFLKVIWFPLWTELYGCFIWISHCEECTLMYDKPKSKELRDLCDSLGEKWLGLTISYQKRW